MSDISLPWGGDVQPDETGDILCVDGDDEIGQRIVRRVLTNPYVSDIVGGVTSDADYAFEPDYGGGVRAYVDAPMSTEVLGAITNRIRDQISKENGVDTSTPANIKITRLKNGLQIDGEIKTPNGQILPLPQMEITP